MKKINTITINSKGVNTMKKTLVVLALAAVLVFAFASVATAKYAGFDANEPYLSWKGAETIYQRINSNTATQTTPHGGYTQTSVKCVVCHSTHRAASSLDVVGAPTAGVGADWSLLNGAGKSCTACHAAWGASPSDALIEVAETPLVGGPHFGLSTYTCTTRGCHGSVHGSGTPSKYAVAVKYNLTNGTNGLLDTQMDAAIAAGNVHTGWAGNQINTTDTGQAMKAFATGYTCFPCHGNSSFAVATRGYANVVSVDGTSTARTGHPSTGHSGTPWVPTCEGCHDMIGFATKSTAFPHANRGIDVVKGRFDNYTQKPIITDVAIPTTEDVTTQYTLWMTSANYHDNANAQPIAGTGMADGLSTGAGNSLQDGVCIKCHEASGLK